MQPYDYTVKYIKGSNNIADCLSRLLCEDKDLSTDMTCGSQDAEQYIRFVAVESTPMALTTREVEMASDTDTEMGDIRSCLLSGKWHTLPHVKYLLVRNKFSAIGKVVLRGTRLVIPCSLRYSVLRLAHEGHPRMKQRLQTNLWWPGIDGDVEKYCKTCHGCQYHSLLLLRLCIELHYQRRHGNTLLLISWVRFHMCLSLLTITADSLK